MIYKLKILKPTEKVKASIQQLSDDIAALDEIMGLDNTEIGKLYSQLGKSGICKSQQKVDIYCIAYGLAKILPEIEFDIYRVRENKLIEFNENVQEV